MYLVGFVLACASGADAVAAAALVTQAQDGASAATSNADGAPPGGRVVSKSRAVTYAVVEQPRLTGYFVGDLLTQRVLLQRDGQTLTPVTLPLPGRASAWFERRRVTTTSDAALRRWLVIEYQILNAPPKLTSVALPGWQLAIKASGGAPPMTLSVPSVSINVAPLSPPGSPEQVGTRDLRADRLPPIIPTEPIRRTMALSAGALALTVIAWIAWVVWRNRRAAATQPFARALRELSALDDGEPRAWQVVHRAFDHTAGSVIQSATLPVLFERAPQLVPARAQIEGFYAQSSLLFFAGVTNGSRTSLEGANTSPGFDGRSEARSLSGIAMAGAAAPVPRALCIELRRIERRHEH